jgi:uncharacterized protein (DUF1684 family)
MGGSLNRERMKAAISRASSPEPGRRQLGRNSAFKRRVGIVAIAILGAACTSGPPPPEDEGARVREIQAWRADKDRMLKSAPDCDAVQPPAPCTPLLPPDRGAFTGLAYYDIDLAYRVPASLAIDPASTGAIIELPTSSSEMRRMRRIGTLKFTLRGTPLQLTAFAEESDRAVNQLFVPFFDQTSGTETYGGGRYLELPRTATGLYDLDFNRAYHPYCVYNPAYICPVPPRENRLQIAIRAGERLGAAAKSDGR